jgi:hypothetical protein
MTAAWLFLAAATTLFVWPRWRAIGAGAIVVSTLVIVSAWPDATLGMLVNLIVVAAVVVGFFCQGAISLRAEYGAGRALEGRTRGAWHEPGRDYVYIELTLDEIRYNVLSSGGNHE